MGYGIAVGTQGESERYQRPCTPEPRFVGCGSDFPVCSPLILVISLRRLSQFGFRVDIFTSAMLAYLLYVREVLGPRIFPLVIV